MCVSSVHHYAPYRSKITLQLNDQHNFDWEESEGMSKTADVLLGSHLRLWESLGQVVRRRTSGLRPS